MCVVFCCGTIDMNLNVNEAYYMYYWNMEMYSTVAGIDTTNHNILKPRNVTRSPDQGPFTVAV